MHIEKIDQELGAIFESPEILSIEKYRALNLINEQIDKIYSTFAHTKAKFNPINRHFTV